MDHIEITAFNSSSLAACVFIGAECVYQVVA
jgi:hypothetical protein